MSSPIDTTNATTNITEVPKIVVLISGSGSNLQSLIDHVASGEISAEISLVISNEANVMGLKRAQQANIPTQLVSHKDHPNRSEFEAELIAAINDVQADLIVLAGFMRILSAEFIYRYAGKVLNIHPSLLPKYKGTNTHQRVLDAGEKIHGASVHFVTEDLDGGPIVIQASVDIEDKDTVPTLASRVLQQEHIIYPIAVKWFCEGRLGLHNQQVTLDNQVLPKQGVHLPST